MLTDQADSAKFCPKCGGDVAKEAVFCHHCAFKLPSETQVEIPVAQTRKLPVLMIGVVGIVIVLAVAGILAYQYRSKILPSTSNNVMSARALNIEERILRGESLSEADISGLTAYELRVLRNVHFARYGRGYDSPGLGDYFSGRPWYRSDPSYQDSMINATDKANINLILAEETRAKATEALSGIIPSISNSNPSTSDSAQSANRQTHNSQNPTLPSDVSELAFGTIENYYATPRRYEPRYDAKGFQLHSFISIPATQADRANGIQEKWVIRISFIKRISPQERRSIMYRDDKWIDSLGCISMTRNTNRQLKAWVQEFGCN